MRGKYRKPFLLREETLVALGMLSRNGDIYHNFSCSDSLFIVEGGISKTDNHVAPC